MLVDWQNYFCESNNSTQSNLCFNAILIKISRRFFTEIIKTYQNSYGTTKDLNTQSNPKQRKKARDYYYRFQNILQNYSHKSSMVLALKLIYRLENVVEDLNLSTRNYRHLIFDKELKTTHWRKDSFVSEWCWKNQMTTFRKMTLNSYILL